MLNGIYMNENLINNLNCDLFDVFMSKEELGFVYVWCFVVF